MSKLKCKLNNAAYPTIETFDVLIPECINRMDDKDFIFEDLLVNKHGIVFRVATNKVLIINPQGWDIHFEVVQKNLRNLHEPSIKAQVKGLDKIEVNRLTRSLALKCIREFSQTNQESNLIKADEYYSHKYQLYCWANYYYGRARVKNIAEDKMEYMTSYDQACELAVSNNNELAVLAYPKSSLDKISVNLLKHSRRVYDQNYFLSQKKIPFDNEKVERGYMMRCIFEGIPSYVRVITKAEEEISNYFL